jgi:hypothetical protein
MLSETAKEQAMYAIDELGVRELDHRTSDGIDVKLLWNSVTNRISVAVRDARAGHEFELAVDGAEALEAFHHPYAFA